MGSRELRTLLEGGHFFESPRWHDGRWWVSDFYRHAVLTVGADGAAEAVLEVEGQPSGLGWMPDGSLLVVSMRDHRLLRRAPDGDVSEHADLTEHCGGHLNDMVVDARGRAYVGNFGFDLMSFADPEETVLVRVDPDGGVHVAAEGLRFPNGAMITPDGATLIVAETIAGRFSVFAIGEDGSLGERAFWQVGAAPELTTFAEMLPQETFTPDGCTLDADGHVWAADAVFRRCCRVAPGGEIVEEIAMPEGLGVFACQLGGEDGRTLLLCCAPDFAEEARRAATEAVLLTTTVEVPHAGLP
jgi:sugar lactone lactonase YvrE